MPHHRHHQRRHNIHVATELHPAVYRAAIGLALWYVFPAWLLFASAGYQLFALVMVSFVILAAIAIPAAAFFSGRRFRQDHLNEPKLPAGPLREWLAGDFDAWQARLSGSEAAVQVLLPLAAVSIGLTLLGLAMLVATA